MRGLVLIGIILIGGISCEDYQQDEYEEYYVVETYLVAERELPRIRFFATSKVEDGYYYDNNYDPAKGNVEIRLLEDGPESLPEQIFSYTLTKKVYLPDEDHRVLPNRTYELLIRFPDSDHIIKATTQVPSTFQIKNTVPDTVTYQTNPQPELTISYNTDSNRERYYVMNSISMDHTEENLTPVYRQFYEDGGYNKTYFRRLRSNFSDIINEDIFSKNADGSMTIKYPWNLFAFYENNLLIINSMDKNVYDIVRSQSVQLGGTTLAPGEIQNVIFNIDGAVGVFGSVASDTASTYLKRAAEKK